MRVRVRVRVRVRLTLTLTLNLTLTVTVTLALAPTLTLTRSLTRCWRPEEMVEPRNTSVPGEPVDVCVWGFEPIVGPPSCSRRPTPATCETRR